MITSHKSNDVEIVSDIKVPDRYYRRLTTGTMVLDKMFGGDELPGLPPFVSILFTGAPGAGKTTMVLQLADLFSRKSDLSVLYNVGEQSKYIIKMSADRMKLRGGFAISQMADVNDLLKYCKDNSVDVLIQDSIQTLTDRIDPEASEPKLIKMVGAKFAEAAGKQNMLIFAVGQVTKGGEFAGPMKLKHTLDIHAHLSFNKDTGNRVFELPKNRFGPAMIPYEFHLNSDGMDFKNFETPTEEAVTKTKGSQKKQAFIEFAKKALLDGLSLSGYPEDCKRLVKWMDEKGYECSGGYWRGIIGMAQRQLESQGHRLQKRTVNRREHVYLEV